MSAREKIITAITAAKPGLTELPAIDMLQVANYNDTIEKFIAVVQTIGGVVEPLKNLQNLQVAIDSEREQGYYIINAVTGSPDENKSIIKQTAIDLEGLYKVYIKASIGVAENGAVWIQELQMINRLLPFICQHLVVVLEKQKLVATMHHAYQQINAFEEGFGVFIAGPSKTADIEQSLVIGAHGARSIKLLLLD